MRQSNPRQRRRFEEFALKRRLPQETLAVVVEARAEYYTRSPVTPTALQGFQHLWMACFLGKVYLRSIRRSKTPPSNGWLNVSLTSHLASDKDCLFVRAKDEIGNRSSLCVKLLHFRPVLEVVHRNLAPHIAQYELALPDTIKVNGMGRFSVDMMRPESR